MLLNLTYPAFLTGRPARHRDEKPCLLALEIEVDVPETTSDAALVVMALHDGSPNGPIALRGFEGQVYRSLGIMSEGLTRYTKSHAFDTRNEVFGSLAHEALRHYFTIRFDRQKPAPSNVAMRDNQFLIEGDAATKIFRMGREFAVSDKDRDRAADLEQRAREQLGRFLIIDGRVWAPTFEFIYGATPVVGAKAGRVFVANTMSHLSGEYEPHIARHPRWSDPETRFFNALSRDAAAEYVGLPAHTLPMIEVMQTSSVVVDFEAMELERCGRLVLREIDKAHSSPRLRDLCKSLFDHLNGRADKNPDELADILSELSAAVRTIDKDALRQFTPDHIDDFVSRWNSRPIEALKVGGPSFTL